MREQNSREKEDNKEWNIEKLVTYFRAGEKAVCDKAGVEIEHFVIGKNGDSMEYKDMVRFMVKLKEETDRTFYEEGHLLGFANADYSITLEPASQLEISIAPKDTVQEIEAIYKGFRKKAEKLLAENGFRLVNTGYHPFKKAEELSLIPKMRYEYMNRYFETAGTLGKHMMRATASTQVSIDYENEKDFVEKYRLACILAPVLALFTDNSPMFEGERTKHHMVRTLIWQNTDKARCGIFPGTFGEDFGYRRYAEYIYNNPAILVMDEGGRAVFTGRQALREIYAEREMSQREIEHALSMFFPDVRLKHYIEIRVADSMELSLVLAYTALIKVLFYNKWARQELLSYFGVVSEEQVEQAKRSLMQDGYAGEAYGKPMGQITEKIIKIARKNSNGETGKYMEYLLEKISASEAGVQTKSAEMRRK